MAISPRQMRIGGAALVAVLLVAGAYVLPGLSIPKTKTVNAELTDDLLASYVSKDSDQDGLPDWQESLYGTDPSVADTDSDGISDGEAVRQGLLTPNALASQLPSDPIEAGDIPGIEAAPGTVTDDFSKAFMRSYLEASGGQPLDADSQQALVSRLLNDYNARVATSLGSSYTSLSVRTDPNVSVTAYASAVEDTLAANAISGDDANVLLHMYSFIQEDDATAKKKLDRIASAYRGIAERLLVMRVPPQLADEHLLLLRSFDVLANSTIAVAAYQEDPIAVLGAFAVFTPAAAQMSDGFDGIGAEILKTGEPGPGQPGESILTIVRTP